MNNEILAEQIMNEIGMKYVGMKSRDECMSAVKDILDEFEKAIRKDQAIYDRYEHSDESEEE